MSQNLDRFSNLEKYKSRADLPKSGFNLGYTSHVGNLIIGRLHPIGYQHVMGGSKVSGSNASRITFHDLVTPSLSPANVFVHNFYCTHRSVNRDWMDMFNPSERNQMSADLKNPMFSLSALFARIAATARYFIADEVTLRTDGRLHLSRPKFVDLLTFRSSMQLFDATYARQFSSSFCLDAFYDLQPQFLSIAPSVTTVPITKEQFIALMQAFFDFWCGEGSLMDYFGYPILNHDIVYRLFSSIFEGYQGDLISLLSDPDEFVPYLESVGLVCPLLNEYPFRHMYSIWYEYYRKPDVEKVSSTLPDYRNWTSTPLLPNDIYLLVTRCRSWASDMFNSALVDGLYRHVYSPTIGGAANATYASPYIGQNGGGITPAPASLSQGGELLSSVKIPYFDPIDNSRKFVTCPLPTAAARMDVAFQNGVALSSDAVDLKALQRSESIARYLTRVDLGDEYRDYMVNQFGSVIEDYRVNRPMLVGSSADSLNISQQTANAGDTPDGNDESGAFLKRQVIASANTNGSDGFSLFISEHGMIISIMSILPLPQYDVEDPHNFIERLMDYPHPLLSVGMEEIMNKNEMSRSLDHTNQPFGHVGYAHAWKQRANEVHGSYLSTRWDNCFTRFFGADAASRPNLSSTFMHCHPALPMFADTVLLNGQCYATIEHNFLAEIPLPQDVERI